MQLSKWNGWKCVRTVHCRSRYVLGTSSILLISFAAWYCGSAQNIYQIIMRTDTVKGNPCSPSPCGPNSVCREINGQPVCSCVAGFLGAPPTCRPECTVSSDCPLTQACSNQKCVNPCPGSCGFRAICNVVNHNPICGCPPELTGDPFVQCVPRRKISCFSSPVTNESSKNHNDNSLLAPEPAIPQNPCEPSPCGPNAECRVVNDAPSCSCLSEYIGTPPNCRPECGSNSECATHLACINQKCRDPCPGSCGANAECRVVSHTPMCACSNDYTGDPFTQCTPTPRKAYKILFLPLIIRFWSLNCFFKTL